MWHLTQPLVHASPTLELLVEERLAGLQDDERDVIELLAVAGELGLDLLEKIAGASVLEALERRGLLMVAKSAQRVEVSLSHPLFAEVINLQLPAVRGRRIRRTLAEALTADGRARGDRSASSLEPRRWRARRRVPARGGSALPLVEGDEAMAERILAQAPEGDRTPEIVQLSPSCASGRGRTPRGRGAVGVDRHRRARRRGPRPGRATAGDEPVLRPGRLPRAVDLLVRTLDNLDRADRP